MGYIRAPHALVTLFVLIVSFCEISNSQQANRMVRPFQGPGNRNKGLPVMCTQDALLIYHDCRMCTCPRPNRIAKCFKKTCDLRTKDSGQCPPALLRMDDGRNCPLVSPRGCTIDLDCPGNQLCCFDFCGGPKCQNPMPLDITTGLQTHSGRGYRG